MNYLQHSIFISEILIIKFSSHILAYLWPHNYTHLYKPIMLTFRTPMMVTHEVRELIFLEAQCHYPSTIVLISYIASHSTR